MNNKIEVQKLQLYMGWRCCFALPKMKKIEKFSYMARSFTEKSLTTEFTELHREKMIFGVKTRE